MNLQNLKMDRTALFSPPTSPKILTGVPKAGSSPSLGFYPTQSPEYPSSTASSEVHALGNASGPSPWLFLEPPVIVQSLDRPPDGGVAAWVQVAGAWCLWNATCLVNIFGIFQAYYQEHILSHESASRISWIGSVQACLYIFGSVLVGPLYDMGYLQHLLVVGSFFTVFGMMMTSICTQYWEFMLAQGVCMGFGMACLWTPSIAVVPPYFEKRKGLAVGLAATGNSIGAIVFATIFEQLVPLIGFASTTRIIGFILLALLILPTIALRKRVAHTDRKALFDITAFKERAFLFFSIVLVLVFIGLYIPNFYLEIFSIQNNILASHSNLNRYLLTFLNCGSFFGRIIPGILSDTIGAYNTIIISTLISGITAFTWIAVRDAADITAFAILYGFFSGSFISLLPLASLAICPDIRRFGTRSGMLAIFISIGLLVGGPIAGALLGGGTNYLPLQIFCGGTILAAALFLVFTRVAVSGLRVCGKV